MTTTEIKNFIDTEISGQGNQVDLSGQLGEVLKQFIAPIGTVTHNTTAEIMSWNYEDNLPMQIILFNTTGGLLSIDTYKNISLQKEDKELIDEAFKDIEGTSGYTPFGYYISYSITDGEIDWCTGAIVAKMGDTYSAFYIDY